MPQTIDAQISHGPFRPLNAEVIAEQSKVTLSSRKKDYLQAFTEHYCSKTGKSKEQTGQFRPYYADQRAISFFHLSLKELCYPIWCHSAQGAKTVDIDGNEYIDVAMDFGISLFGHQADFIKKAVQAQLEKGWAIGMRPEKSPLVAEKLCRITGMERAVFCQSGTEAVMSAVRIARHVSKKKKVVIFSSSYHGHSDCLIAIGVRSGDRMTAKPITPGTTPGAIEDLVILEYCAPESLQIIASLKNELAAVVAEPVQSRSLNKEPEEFLNNLRKLTKEMGVALIFDEMVTGFRVAPGGVQEYFQVKPDLATYGKIVGGGLCIGAIAGSAKYLDAVDGGPWEFGDNSYPQVDKTFFAGTHCQNALAMAAADAVLNRLLEEGPALQQALNEKCAAMCTRINVVLEREGLPIRALHFGSLFRFDPIARVAPVDQNLFTYHLRDNGVMVSEVGNNFLSTAHTQEDIDHIVTAVENSVAAMKSGGYWA